MNKGNALIFFKLFICSNFFLEYIIRRANMKKEYHIQPIKDTEKTPCNNRENIYRTGQRQYLVLL